VAVVCIGGCGSQAPTPESTRSTASAIQAGATDSTHTFAVGVVQFTQTQIEFCSGSLLARNLVATARHCVAQISSPQIDCSVATFGQLVPTSEMFVTTDTTITPSSSFYGVSAIHVPSQSGVCGSDIALLVLDQPITLPSYVTPAISPPLTDSSRSTTVTAIGYGIDTPTDDAGTTAGTRRIKENVMLQCIPHDPSPSLDCFRDPTAAQYMTAGEFMSADQTTCEGDSGSGVYDQVQFDRGNWVSYGVLSRGSVSSDGLDCVQPIYTRFDAWGSLLAQAANDAAARGGYPLPSWATAISGGADAGFAAAADASQGNTADAGGTVGATSPGSSGVGGSGTSQPPSGADGDPCGTSSACLSQNCVSFDGNHFYCATACGAGGTCQPGFVCEGQAHDQYCFSASAVPSSKSGSSGGCAVGEVAPDRSPSTSNLWAVLGIAVVAVRRARRAAGTSASTSKVVQASKSGGLSES
jgi:hypothetical protein